MDLSQHLPRWRRWLADARVVSFAFPRTQRLPRARGEKASSDPYEGEDPLPVSLPGHSFVGSALLLPRRVASPRFLAPFLTSALSFRDTSGVQSLLHHSIRLHIPPFATRFYPASLVAHGAESIPYTWARELIPTLPGSTFGISDGPRRRHCRGRVASR